jgi:glycosyltransferase involved in cell wall biosynthesis
VSAICFASWHGYAGCVTSCRHAAAVLGGTWVALDDGADPPDCDVLVLSSWADAYEPLLEAFGGKVVGRWHSSLLQTELSREGWKLVRLLERVDTVVADDADVAAALQLAHLPNVFDPAEAAAVAPVEFEGINVALPGEPHGRKNLLVQTAAFERSRAGRDWTLHLFGQTERRPGYARWLELARIPHVDHGFLERDRYLAHVAGMDAALCASMSESYGYAAAEAVELGVPTVATPAVRSFDAGPLSVRDPSSVADVTAALERALTDEGVTSVQRESLHRRAAENEAVARAALRRL